MGMRWEAFWGGLPRRDGHPTLEGRMVRPAARRPSHRPVALTVVEFPQTT